MRTLMAAFFVFAAGTADAAILYKLVDPSGNVTFTDNVPRGFQGNVTRLDIETGANLITPTPSDEPAAPVARAPIDYEWLTRRQDTSGEERLRAAAQRVDDAKAALVNAQNNSLATDWIYLGSNNPLGMRRMPRPEYQARLEQLASNVVVAESEYDALRQQLR